MASLRDTINQSATATTAHDQREFLHNQVKKKSQYHQLVFSIDAKHGNIVDMLTNIVRTSSTKTFTHAGQQHYCPRIPPDQQQIFCDAINHYIDRLLATIAATHSIQARQLDVPATKRTLLAGIRDVPDLSTNEQICLRSLRFAMLLEQIRDSTQAQATEYLRFHPLLEMTARTNAFVVSKPGPQIPALKTLIPNDAAAVATTVTYNLTPTQLHHLVQAMFQSNHRMRTHSRIALLSSLRNDLRSDVVVNPSAVLQRAFSEYYLSRREILMTIFDVMEKNAPSQCYRCPWCSTTIDIDAPIICHPRCHVVQWLHDNYQVTLTSNGFSLPTGYLLDCATSQYASNLVALDAQHRLQPLVSRTSDELSVWSVNDAGDPKKVLSHGVRTVRMSSPATKPP